MGDELLITTNIIIVLLAVPSAGRCCYANVHAHEYFNPYMVLGQIAGIGIRNGFIQFRGRPRNCHSTVGADIKDNLGKVFVGRPDIGTSA